jgi:hypothetical protein
MKIADYAIKARSTAIYPDSARFSYPALGLAGEVGEFLDKATQDGYSDWSQLTLELGDILWYMVSVAGDCGITFTDIANELSSGSATFSAVDIEIPAHSTIYAPIMRLPIYAGRIAEVAKKTVRDDDGFTAKRHTLVFDALVELLRSLYVVADQLGIGMDDVAEANINKLFARKEAGTLQGDGDNR